MSKYIDTLFQQAIQHFEQGSFSNVKNLLNNVLLIKPNHFDALHMMGVVLGIENQHKEALIFFNKALKINPLNSYINFNLAKALSETGNDLQSLKYHQEAIRLSPTNAEFLLNFSKSLYQLRRFDEALANYDRVIQIKPDYAEAWSNRGIVLNDLKRLDEALANHDRAIQIKPDYAEAWSNRGIVLNDLKRFDEALANYDRAIQIKPDYAEAWFNKGISLNETKCYDEALAHYDKAIQLKPNYYDAFWNKALINLVLGKFDQGWNLYEHRWSIKNPKKYRHHHFKELESLDFLPNKTILVWHEQGLGDSIQFSRYIPELIKLGSNVIFEVQEPLLSLFNDQLGCIVTSNIASETKVDFQVPLLKLPKLFKTTVGNIPPATNFHPTNHHVSLWKHKLNLSDKKLNIGLAISGNRNHTNDFFRSMHLKDFSDLLEYGEFYLLQKELDKVDREMLSQFQNVSFLGDQIDDFLDTASIVMNLDLIVSVDTSLIHLAGSLNKPSYLMLPWCPEWRWLLDRSDSPWYPSIEIFRQQSLGDWGSVINQLKQKLEAKLCQ
jgi:tetratricopeptide (TPR) repeat protein